MSDAPQASIRRSRLSWVWLIPLVAAGVAGWLAWRTLSDQGPLITISFHTGDGLTAGQTRVRFKAVELGQVESVNLTPDMSNVLVRVRMRKEADPYLTDQARFWVVRARLSSGSLSGIETLVSGSYIEMDPGSHSDTKKYEFTGLETPPAVRSGEPGTTYQLRAERLGSLGPGAPVFYRDINVGEVLNYNIGNGLGPVTIDVFVRAPYDKLVRDGTHFWNASGLSVQIGAEGLHVELASLQAVLNGGVAYDAPKDPNAKPAAAGSQFRLFHDYQEAQSSGYKTRQAFITYFEQSVSGLGVGSAVDFFGIQVGQVTGVELDLNPDTGRARVRVRFEVQPERITNDDSRLARENPVEVARRLVAKGLRVQLQTASYLTGSKTLALDFDRDKKGGGDLVQENGDWVIPSEGGGLDNILASASNIMTKINRIPLDEIGANLNGTLRSASGAANNIGELASRANSGLSPVFARLPAITAALEGAVSRADRLFGSVDRSYGKDSDIQRELERAVVQVGDTARSVRLLADFLDRHPEALIRGRANYSQ